mgnify:CR=1 FL=1
MPKHNLLTQEQFIVDCNAKHGLGTYDYSEVDYVRGRDKIKVICPKHGPWYPPARKHREGTGCRQCYVEGKKIDRDTMYERFLDTHGDLYEYDFNSYNGAKSTIKIKCSEHGWFPQICEVHALGSGCQDCGRVKTAASRVVSYSEFISRCIENFGDRYQYIESSWTGIDSTIEFICPEHGPQSMLAQSHLRSPTGCHECSLKQNAIRSSLSHDEFIQRSTAIHDGKYDYSKTVYKKGRESIEIICPIHDSFFQIAESHIAGQGCKKCADEDNGRKKSKRSESDFWIQIKAVHGDTYDLSKTTYTGIYDKVKVGCLIHGEFDIPASSFKQGRGCRDCGKERTRLARTSTKDDFIKKAKTVHGDIYKYDNVQYVSAKSDVMITCKKHGDFPQQPTNHLSGNGCPACGNYGFDPMLPAILYYIKVEVKNSIGYKVGITNRSIRERFYSEMDKILVLHTESYEVGFDAYKEEQKILNQYAEYKFKGDPLLTSGNTEMFSIDVLELDTN